MSTPPIVYDGKEPYIFVSYSYKNRKEAYAIITVMQKQGYRIWYDDRLEKNKSKSDVIGKIENCFLFMCFLSKNYIASQYCIWESGYALKDLQKTTVPVYLWDYKKTHALLPLGIRMNLK